MIASIALVLVIAVWSAAREREDSLADFSGKQELLATAVAADFEHRLETSDLDVPGARADAVLLELLAGAKRFETDQDLLVLVSRPGDSGFLASDGRVIPSDLLRSAVDAGKDTVFLPRDAAASFGLPRRMAVAALERVPARQRGEWTVAVLVSARRLRDRQILEERRLAATVVVVTIVVAAFGLVARRRQRSELDLARKIAVAELEREREAALARADKMAALAALSTGIAHEVGTPLGVIVGRVEQVLDSANEERNKAALGVVLEQVDRIRRIVRGCLALARGDAPQLVKTEPETVAVRAMDLVRHRFAAAGVELRSEIEPALPAIACEPALFEQALVNLLLNACEATPAERSVCLSVRAGERLVEFIVDDEGAGIPEEVAKRATEPFFSTRVADGGSGLGLTIAREIVNHHAGTLSVSARAQGGGTRATISIATS